MEPKRLTFDSKLRGRAILALQRAIVATFNQGDWQELGYQIGHHDYIARHDRLLRSLHWGDEDYGGCVFQFLNFLAQQDPLSLYEVGAHEKVKKHLAQNAPDVLTDMELSDDHVPPLAPSALSAKDVVRRALNDADSLLHSSGATSAIDRLHTALHGYLRSVCEESGIHVAENASITALFKSLRTNHTVLKNLGTQDAEIGRIMAAFSTVVDALNTIRNHASVAHPNDELLDEAEAVLTLNVVRTLFNYLVRKIG